MCTLFPYLIFPYSLHFIWYKLPVLKKLLKPVTVEILRLFSTPFSHSSLQFITCEMNFFEMFLESCKQPEFRGCKIWNLVCKKGVEILQSKVLYNPCSGSTSVGYGVSQNCNNKPVFNYSAISVWVIHQFSWVLLLNFCLFKSCVVVTGLSDHCLSFQSKFPHSFLIFYPSTHRTYVHSIFTIMSQ